MAGIITYRSVLNAAKHCMTEHIVSGQTKFTTVDTYYSLLFVIVERGERSIMMKIIGWFCGISDTQAPEPTEEEVTEASKQLPDISENPLWKNIVNVNALIMMTVAVYFWGYYA